MLERRRSEEVKLLHRKVSLGVIAACCNVPQVIRPAESSLIEDEAALIGMCVGGCLAQLLELVVASLESHLRAAVWACGRRVRVSECQQPTQMLSSAKVCSRWLGDTISS